MVARINAPSTPCTVTLRAMERLRREAAFRWLAMWEKFPDAVVELPFGPGNRVVYRLVDRQGVGELYTLVRCPDDVEGVPNNLGVSAMAAYMRQIAHG